MRKSAEVLWLAAMFLVIAIGIFVFYPIGLIVRMVRADK